MLNFTYEKQKTFFFSFHRHSPSSPFTREEVKRRISRSAHWMHSHTITTCFVAASDGAFESEISSYIFLLLSSSHSAVPTNGITWAIEHDGNVHTQGKRRTQNALNFLEFSLALCSRLSINRKQDFTKKRLRQDVSTWRPGWESDAFRFNWTAHTLAWATHFPHFSHLHDGNSLNVTFSVQYTQTLEGVEEKMIIDELQIQSHQ